MRGIISMALKTLAVSRLSIVRSGFMAASFAIAMLFSTLTMAQTTTPCDPQYMDALKSRAYLEAQREISMNQNLIFKPDSVFEYSCFDKIMGALARAPGDRKNFSESDRWGEVPNHDTDSLNRAFDEVVTVTLEAYWKANYSHTYLGGRIQEDYRDVGGVELLSGKGGAYTCEEMDRVWRKAKCANFQGAPVGDWVMDQFYDFDKLKSYDPRQLPTACQTNGITDEWIKRAFNNEQDKYVLSPENDPLDGILYTVDPLVTYLNKINPFGVAPATTCDPEGIPTGVIVYRQGAPTEYYYEKVCPNPGCYYVPSGQGTSAAKASNLGSCKSNP